MENYYYTICIIFFALLLFLTIFLYIKWSISDKQEDSKIPFADQKETHYKRWYYSSLVVSSFLFLPLLPILKDQILELFIYYSLAGLFAFLFGLLGKLEWLEFKFLKTHAFTMFLTSLIGFVIWGAIYLLFFDFQYIEKIINLTKSF